MDDARIFALLEDRNPEAAAALHEAYAPWCRGIALRILGDQKEAESCVSDTWLFAWGSIPPEKPPMLRAWLGRVTRELALSRCLGEGAPASPGPQVQAALRELRECVSSLQEEADRTALAAGLESVLEGLPLRDRNIFLRRYWHLSSPEAIARVYGIAPRRVEAILSRCREKLRRAMTLPGTETDLLFAIGRVRDGWIMDSRRRPSQKGTLRLLTALAAVLALALVGGILWQVLSARETAEARLSDSPTVSAAPVPSPSAADEASATEVELDDEAPEPEEAAMLEAPDLRALGAELLAGTVPLQYDPYQELTEDTLLSLTAFSYASGARYLSGQAGSACFSPVGLYTALCALGPSAESQTLEELLSVLGQGDAESAARALQAIDYAVDRREQTSYSARLRQLRRALFLRERTAQGVPIQPAEDWALTTGRTGRADVYRYSGSSDALVNAWTRAWCQEECPPVSGGSGDLTLAGACRFSWALTGDAVFDAAKTETGVFTSDDGTECTADFMCREDDTQVEYLTTDRYAKACLSFGGDERLRLIFVLPAEGVPLDSLITEEGLWEVFENGDYQVGPMSWRVPRFTAECGGDFRQVLEAMGLRRIFTDEAELSPISGAELSLSAVVQSFRFQLDETGVNYPYENPRLSEFPEPEADPEAFVMDLSRPFLYMLVSEDGLPLVIGAVRSPE